MEVWGKQYARILQHKHLIELAATQLLFEIGTMLYLILQEKAV